MKILYVEDEEALLNLISMEIEAELDCQVIEITSGNKAITWLKENDLSDLKAVISDHKMPDGSGAVLFSYIKENHPTLPFILTTGSAEANNTKEFAELLTVNPRNSIQIKPFHLDILIEKIKDIVASEENLPLNNFLRVSHSRFRKAQVPPCDIYLKMSDEKYLKISNAHEEITEDFLEKYVKKGVDYFYVTASDFQLFSKYYNDLVKNQLQQNNLIEEKVDYQLQGFESIQDYVQNIGLDGNVVETMNIVTKSSVEVMRNNPDLFKLVERMMHEENYLSEHSIMISYIAGALALEMEWVTSATLQKLATAALLHDIHLADPHLARMSHRPEEEWGLELRPEQVELIRRHPIIMADIIKKTKGIEPDVDVIIFNHHETADGHGYPRRLDHHKIFPLAAFFIVSECFVNEIYGKKPSKQEIDQIIKQLEKKFNKGNFKKAVEALQKVFSNPYHS